MEKKELNIGQSGDTWSEDYKENLTKALEDHYGGHIPIHLSSDSIGDYLHTIYSDCTASRISAGIKYHIHPKQPFAPESFTQGNIIGIREWTPIGRVGIDEEDYIYLNSKQLLLKSNIECKVGLYKSDRKLYFIYPRIPYMDLSRMFYSVYSVVEKISDDQSKRQYEVKRDKLVKVSNKDSDKDWIEVTLSGEPRRDEAIIHAAHYLIDYLLSYTIACPKKGKCSYNNLNDIINHLEKGPLKYRFTLGKELERLVTKNDFCDKMVVQLRKIAEKASERTFIIPQYTINMSPLFELYSYSQKYEKFQCLKFQHVLATASKKKGEARFIL